jgi:hypothetical protein
MKAEIVNSHVEEVSDVLGEMKDEIDPDHIMACCDSAISYLKALKKMAESEYKRQSFNMGRDL